MVCKKHREMAESAGDVLGVIMIDLRTCLCGYNIKVLLLFTLLISQTVSLPLNSIKRDMKREKFTFPDPEQSEFVHSLKEYEISHPHRISADGSFLSHQVHHRVRRDTGATRGSSNKIHSSEDIEDQQVHYKVTLSDTDLHLSVRPNHRLLAPGFVVEHRNNKFGNVSDASITPYTDDLCHFTGVVQNHTGSSVAIGTCYGLHGFVRTNEGDYFIEPVKGHQATVDGAQPHLVYKSSALPGTPHDHHGDTSTMQCTVKDGSSSDSDREAWEEKHKNSRPEKGAPSGNRRHKRSVSLERYVETLVVVDDKMYEHYKDEDLRNYVLTIMNMVTTIYHESTIGNDINIVLVRLVMGKIEIDKFVEAEEQKSETKLEITHHAEKTLSSFCKWQKEINPPKDHSNHHDVAVLITRYNICSKRNAPCSTLGLSHVSGMCQPHRSCNVNEDTGLALAYTVAHEIGHNFGMQHDNPGSECVAEEGHQLVMSPVLNGASPLVWSNCSKDAITKFLDRDWGYCLNNEPAKPDFPFPNRPPGIMYDADHQCKLQYGPTAKHCAGIDDLCKTLWCKVDNKCLTRLEAAAEGTICGTNKWCYAGNCMPISDDSPEAIHGEWGSWGSWTDCSRTCGAGVSHAERHCDNPHPSNGGKYCLGERKRYRICNTEKCGEEEMNFRAYQCAEFNSIPYRSKIYDWEPVTTYDNSCQLHCKPQGEFFSVMMKDMVTDGTACRIGRRDMCISGKCRTIGCDWVIDSESKEDSCGMCHGDGTTCKTVRTEFKEKNGKGYVEAMIVPEGARHIRVQEVAEANNYLAVANDKGQYYLNGYWFIQWSGDYDAGGTVLHYTREGNREEFYVPGPLKEDLHIMLLFQSSNPGVRTEYTVANANATDRRIPEFYWKHLPWTHCTVSCGGGYQRSTVVCVEREAGIVDDFYCNISSKPDDRERVCNDHLCPARWWAGPWQHCSVSCGDNGIHHRTVMCVRSHGQSEQQALDDYECAAQDKPASIEPCHHKDPCPDESYWQAGQWSDCIGICGKGVQRRNVSCLGLMNCKPELKPLVTKDCYLGPCDKSKSNDYGANDIEKSSWKSYKAKPAAVVGGGQSEDWDDGRDAENSIDTMGHLERKPGVNDEEEKPHDPRDFKWVPLAWEECIASCGGETTTRQLLCIELSTLDEVDQSLCDTSTKPQETKSCDLEPCLDWTTTEWSECSVSCGQGLQVRSLSCPEPDRCDTMVTPPSEQICKPGVCLTWITGPWNECSKSCGGGEQYRHLQCVNTETQQSIEGCDPNTEPDTRQPCHSEPCPAQQEELNGEKTYQSQCTGDSMAIPVCKALKNMGQCRQRYVQIKCCDTCHKVIAAQLNKNRGSPAS